MAMSESGNIVKRDINGVAFEVITLRYGDAAAEIWPALGGNCVSWSTAAVGDILWSPEISELVGRPTRGGIPVLFPFPNRIRAGQFTFAGRGYQLPCNDSMKVNAIHGFSPRLPWQVTSTSEIAATLNFRISRDAPESAGLWPGDAELTLTWELNPTLLSCRTDVRNLADGPVPFGLGFHPYFRLTGPDDRIRVPASARWELVDNLPSGSVVPVDAAFDLRRPRRVGDLNLDDVYTSLDMSNGAGRLYEAGRLTRADGVEVVVRVSPNFGEVVVFTPSHGKAVCLEPYTCPTDAVNLDARGLPVGWKKLLGDEAWIGEVRYELGRG
jgi:aldose 1-epimerase